MSPNEVRGDQRGNSANCCEQHLKHANTKRANKSQSSTLINPKDIWRIRRKPNDQEQSRRADRDCFSHLGLLDKSDTRISIGSGT
jgi:hypothetical protein